MTFNQPWHAIQHHLGEKDQHRENSSRLAISNGFITATGSGEHQESAVIRFGCVFVERPAVAYGWSIDGDLLEENQFPRVSAGVYGWDRDQKGRYLGAFVMVTVDIPTGLVEDLSYDIDIDFTFSGIAIKDIPDYLLDD